jgi:E3 ubiquitin-protein ligase RNF115/126
MRTFFCPCCSFEHPASDDPLCPICGTALLPTPQTEAGTQNNASSVVDTLAIEQIQHIGNIGGIADVMEQDRAILDRVLSMSLQTSMVSSLGASENVISQLPRFTVDDERCTVLHEIVLEVQVRTNAETTPVSRIFFETQVGAFAKLPKDSFPRELCFGDPPEGDKPFSNGADMQGRIVVLKRGIATFVAKAKRAQESGCSAVIVVQTVPVWPYTMKDSTGEAAESNLLVPVVMVRQEDGPKLQALVQKDKSSFVCGILHAQPLELNCPVCQDEYGLGSVVARLPCRHLFHDACVTAWLVKHATCPICRFELATDDGAQMPERAETQRGRARDATYLSWFS